MNMSMVMATGGSDGSVKMWEIKCRCDVEATVNGHDGSDSDSDDSTDSETELLEMEATSSIHVPAVGQGSWRLKLIKNAKGSICSITPIAALTTQIGFAVASLVIPSRALGARSMKPASLQSLDRFETAFQYPPPRSPSNAALPRKSRQHATEVAAFRGFAKRPVAVSSLALLPCGQPGDFSLSCRILVATKGGYTVSLRPEIEMPVLIPIDRIGDAAVATRDTRFERTTWVADSIVNVGHFCG
jgi:hypothetical protein